MNQRRREAAATETAAAGVAVADDVVTGEAGRPVPVRIYRAAPTPAPVVVYCHAGGFALGNLDTDHRQCLELARRARCAVVSVDYRLAPEHPYPAALHDAIEVLTWVVGNATRLGFDARRLAVAGSSAGATLAAGLAHGAADGSLPPVIFQLLHQPVLDDRPTASRSEFRATPAFDGEAASLMWRHYLAGQTPSPESVPARSTGRPASDVDHLRRDRSVSRRSARLRAAAAGSRGIHRTAHLPARLPRVRFATTGMDDVAAAVRDAGSCPGGRVLPGLVGQNTMI